MALEEQHALEDRVKLRQHRFMALQQGRFPRCPVLLVGDRPAPSAPDDPSFHYTPFGAMTNSSLWLNRLLEQAKIPENKLAWINAYDLHGAPTDYEVLKHGWQRIIALGNNASRWLSKAPSTTIIGAEGVLHWKIYHPQAWKRFHHGEPYPLVALIREVLKPDPTPGTPANPAV